MKVAVVGPIESVLGFKLAGVHSFECVEENADEVVATALGDESVGLLIVPGDLSAWLSQKSLKSLENSSKPVVVFVPGKDGRSEKSSDLAVLIKRAIGIELK
ncbi:V-type ATP synthase subunit F [Candidatus Micrarchaeota archaeon]|nr:V-type ATP synthase subunit F [Candidatus Micrarchaeota archaeon]